MPRNVPHLWAAVAGERPRPGSPLLGFSPSRLQVLAPPEEYLPLALVLLLLGVALGCWLPCYWHWGSPVYHGGLATLLRGDSVPWYIVAEMSAISGSRRGGVAQARIPAPGLSPLLLQFWAAAVALPLALVL